MFTLIFKWLHDFNYSFGWTWKSTGTPRLALRVVGEVAMWDDFIFHTFGYLWKSLCSFYFLGDIRESGVIPKHHPS